MLLVQFFEEVQHQDSKFSHKSVGVLSFTFKPFVIARVSVITRTLFNSYPANRQYRTKWFQNNIIFHNCVKRKTLLLSLYFFY